VGTNTLWCRRRGSKHTPKSFDLVKIWAESLKIRAKSVKTFAKSLKIWTNSLKIRAKIEPYVLLFEKNGDQRVQNHMKTFFVEVILETCVIKKSPKNFSGKFGKIGRKSFAPPKI